MVGDNREHADIAKPYRKIIYSPILVIYNLSHIKSNLSLVVHKLFSEKKNMAENLGRYSYILSIALITLLVIFLGFIREIFKHQTRQIRYTRNQLFKIGKTFYKTKVNNMTANIIKNVGTRQTFRPPRRDKKKKRGKRGGKNMSDYGTQIKECTETCLFHLKGTTKLHGIPH